MSCGIYKIQSKSNPEMFYVGSSKTIEYRITDHFKKLSKGEGSCIKLQNYVIKNGVNDLQYKILKKCNEEHLIFWEQFYISELQPTLNSFRFAGRDCGVDNISVQNIAFNDMAKYNNKDRDINYNLLVCENDIMELCNKELIPEIIYPFNI
jgi:group I intron endonuclease